MLRDKICFTSFDTYKTAVEIRANKKFAKFSRLFIVPFSMLTHPLRIISVVISKKVDCKHNN
jgi:hypothetical protein